MKRPAKPAAPRRGRPPVSGETRTQQIRVRLTEAEHERLHAHCVAHGMDAAELVRLRLDDVIRAR